MSQKVIIGKNSKGIPEENVLDLRKIYEEKKVAKVTKKRVIKKEVKENKLKKFKKKRENKLKKWLETRKTKKTKKEPDFFDEGVVINDGVGWWQDLVKPLVGFVVVCLILVLPFTSSAFYQKALGVKDQVLNTTEEALVSFKSGGLSTVSSDYGQAQDDFKSAVIKFQQAREELDKINSGLSVLGEMEAAENILIAGENISEAAVDLNKVAAILTSLKLEEFSQTEDEEMGLTTLIMVAHSALRPAVSKIEKAREAMSKVSLKYIPEEEKSVIELAQEILPKLEHDLKKVLSLSESLMTILGHDSPKRYLVLFQNNHELRATGGFLGSLAVVEVDKGKIKGMDIPGGGIYDVSGQFTEKIASPEPLHLVNPYWNLQDANWWPDWPTSAKKIEWFYYRSGGKAIDGVITINQYTVIELLKVTGPIDMTENYGVTIGADNFYQVIQTEAEKKYDETQKSKQIIADLTPLLLDRLFELEGAEMFGTLNVLDQGLKEKDILFYFNDSDLQSEIVDLGWAGELKGSEKDYLSVINTNIGGGKTDDQIEEIINHQSKIGEDGSIINEVTITRTHKAKSEEDYAQANNMDYLRVYVPENSELISAKGFDWPQNELWLEAEEEVVQDSDLQNISGEIMERREERVFINQELGKTVFAGWVETKIGESSQIVLTYRLPFKIKTDKFWDTTDTYSLLTQKQPGSFDSLLISELILPDNWEVLWESEEGVTQGLNEDLTKDVFWGTVLRKK